MARKKARVLVSFEAAGLCHSDHHVREGGLPLALPLIGGHEGAGIVQEVGPGVRNLNFGDHVGLVPAGVRTMPLGVRSGHETLCDLGAQGDREQLDGGFRRHAKGRDIGALAWLGAFAQYGTVPETSWSRSTTTSR